MTDLLAHQEGTRCLLMGNEAMARGALEAGVNVAAGYPGTPSSEIIENLANAAQNGRLYVEWSTNEKVALEVAAAASFAGLRSLCVMKQNGVNVASDFLLHLAGSGTRGGMVLVACDDPGALSSVNEGESRHFARLVEIPLLEPGGFQEALDMMKWAFALSEKIRNIVMVRSVTRLSHASGNVVLGPLPGVDARAVFRYNGNILDPMEGPVISMPVTAKHGLQQKKLRQAVALFDTSPFNTYTGPDAPEILCITASAGYLYSKEAINLLGLEDRVGLLKLGTTWPLPSRLLAKYLALTHQILIVEEVTSFLEDNVKILAAGMGPEIGVKTFFGKTDGTIPSVGELNPDIVIHALLKITGVDYQGVPADYTQRAETIADTGAPARDLTFCPGCPHRASFWSIHMALQMDNRQGFVCGDIGCYSLAIFPTGFSTLKTVHSMGSGTGIASGFGKLGPFGMNQPVLAVCGDSTFFHAVLPALVNAVHQRSEITLVVLDNSGTAMTGFQPHPGLSVDASGNAVPGLDIAQICEAIGAGVRVCDPFDLETTRQTLFDLLESRGGVNVLILKKRCALSPERKARKDFEMSVDQAVCLGSNCGCNRLCTRIFRCPGLIWNKEKKMTEIDEVICVGCGVCASICPSGAVVKKEKA
ncbi:MAG: indolepyruvate ferredoxin oxidoreductase [Deltaproteobacteria bacterium]|nr:MAG: indolepyruvate ferredoxin oxidoreductase [Deltaproteobacteria bacterium]